MTVSAVIRRLHNMISQSEYYEHIYDTNDRCGGEVENGNTDNQMTLEARKRDDILLSIDAIMNRVNVPICKYEGSYLCFHQAGVYVHFSYCCLPPFNDHIISKGMNMII